MRSNSSPGFPVFEVTLGASGESTKVTVVPSLPTSLTSLGRTILPSLPGSWADEACCKYQVKLLSVHTVTHQFQNYKFCMFTFIKHFSKYICPPTYMYDGQYQICFLFLHSHLVSTVNCMPEYFLHTNNRLSTTQIIFFPNSSFIFFLLFIAYTMYQKHLPTCELKFSTTPTVDKMNFSADEPPSLLHALLSNETDRSLFSGLKLTTCGPLKLIWVLLVGASVCEQYTYIYMHV